MKELIERMFGRYGRLVTVTRGGVSRESRGFFQPSASRGTERFRWEQTPLGTDPEGEYLYIGPTEPEIKKGDTLTLGGTGYQVRRAEVFYDRKGPVYLWCLCAEAGRADTWGE